MIPGADRHDTIPLFGQDCQQRVPGDFSCCVAESKKKYYVIDGHTAHHIDFNVLGGRPISLTLEMLWVDHYPVHFNLSLSSDTALNNSILHVSHPLLCVRSFKLPFSFSDCIY